jgi:hypothetical protein
MGKIRTADYFDHTANLLRRTHSVEELTLTLKGKLASCPPKSSILTLVADKTSVFVSSEGYYPAIRSDFQNSVSVSGVNIEVAHGIHGKVKWVSEGRVRCH